MPRTKVITAKSDLAPEHHIREDLIDHIRAKGDPAKLPADGDPIH